jgi:hypothetical protein
MPATGECVEIGGVTSENKDIIMNINHDSKMNRLHEIFHTFGFVDFNESERGYGIMNYPPYQPGKEDANSLINNHFLPIIYEYKSGFSCYYFTCVLFVLFKVC